MTLYSRIHFVTEMHLHLYMYMLLYERISFQISTILK